MKADDERRILGALDKPAASRSYEDILLIKSYISTLDLIKTRFATIRSEQLDNLCRDVNIEIFQPRAPIFQKGDYADKMYIVFAGCCSLIDSTQVGEKESSNECFSGMSFGEDAILANVHRPSAAFNESAFVTKLLSVDRLSYLAFLADAYDANSTLSSNSKPRGSIENIVSILQKPRHIRTASDVESLAAFLGREIPFFQQFHNDQLQELCLIIDAAQFWGQQLLFQQGQRGQAFYSILSGNVQVWVAAGNLAESINNDKKIIPEDETQIQVDTDNLGVLITTLPKSITFGEQTVERENKQTKGIPYSSMRQSSVMTGEGTTILLVVDWGEYEDLLPLIQNKEVLDKVTLLRKTGLLQRMDAKYLPISYATDQVLYTEGWTDGEDDTNGNIAGITVIVVGECRVDAEVEITTTSPKCLPLPLPQGFDYMMNMDSSFGMNGTNRPLNKKGKISRVDLGRIGPGGVLYHFNANEPEEDGKGMLHKETVTAVSPVLVYTVTRGDFYFKLDSATREAIVKEIDNDTDALRGVSEEQLRKREAWADFKLTSSVAEKMKMGNKNRSLIDSFRMLEGVQFTATSESRSISNHLHHGLRPSTVEDGSQHGRVKLGAGSRGTSRRDQAAGEFDEDIEFIRRSLGTSTHRGPALRMGTTRSSGMWSSNPDPTVAASMQDMKEVDRSHSMDIIRAIQRNKRRIGPKKHRLAFLQDKDGSSPPPPSSPGLVDLYGLSATPAVSIAEDDALESEKKVQPFSLVHIHRETISILTTDDDQSDRKEGSTVNGSTEKVAGAGLELLGGRRRRVLRCHLRLCGSMRSPESARECAEAQIQHAFLCSGNRSNQTQQQPPLVWRKFSGFEAIPSQHTDHFIVYCRSAPVEYGSFTPPVEADINFLREHFPFACKTIGQNFACFTARPISFNVSSSSFSSTSASLTSPLIVPLEPAAIPAKNEVTGKSNIRTKKASIKSISKKININSDSNDTLEDVYRKDSSNDKSFLSNWKRGAAAINAQKKLLKVEVDPEMIRKNAGISVDFIIKNNKQQIRQKILSSAEISALKLTHKKEELALRVKNKPSPSFNPMLVRSLQYHHIEENSRHERDKERERMAEELETIGGESEDGIDDTSDKSSTDSDDSDGDAGSILSTSRKTPKYHISSYNHSIEQQQRRKLAQPMFLLELSVFRETHATLASKADCLAFALSLLKKKSTINSWYTCIAPLYEWILVDDPTLKKINVTSSQSTGIGTGADLGGLVLTPSSLPLPLPFTIPSSPSLHIESSSKSVKALSFGPGADTTNIHSSVESSVPNKRASTFLVSTSGKSDIAVSHGAVPSSSSNGKAGGGFVSSLGFGLGGNQEAKDARCALLKELIETRKGVLLSHDRLCSNEDSNRKREELSTRFHLLPSIMAATTKNCSQYDISLALKRRNVAKQHIKLLDSLIFTAPNRTVPHRGK